MKKNCLITLFLLMAAFTNSTAQQLHWRWAKQVNALLSGNETISPVVNGTFYAVGNFKSSQLVINSTIITVPDSGNNFFLAKYDTVGNLLWAKGVSDYGWDVLPNCMTVDKQGNVYLCGSFLDSLITFDSQILYGQPVMLYGGTPSYFIVKYDPSGHVIWANTANGSPSAESMCTDLSNNVYVTGVVGTAYPANIASFDHDTINGTPSAGGLNFFLAKYDENGSVKWVRSATVPPNSTGGNSIGYQPITCDTMGNIYVALWLNDSAVTFGNHTIYDSLGHEESCLVKYDTLGNVRGAKIFNSLSDPTRWLSITSAGNLYYLGSYIHTLNLGSVTLIAADSLNTTYFLAKYDSSERVLWAINLPKYPDCITTDAVENVYVAGGFTDTIISGKDTIISLAAQNTYILKFNTNGQPLWAQNIPGNWNVVEYGLTVDDNGNVYIAGDFQDTAEFAGSDTFTNASGIPRLYIASLNQCNDVVPVINRSAFDTLNTQTFASYQWLINGVPINKAKSQSYIPYQDGDYQVQVTDSGGCRGLSSVLQVLNLGIKSNPNPHNISLYPNPGNGTFALTTREAMGSELTVYNSLGYVVKSGKIINDNQLIDLSSDAAGFYYVVVKIADTIYNVKAILLK